MDFATARLNMVESQLRTNRVTDRRVLDAMGAVPRELFVPKARRPIAYVDEDLEIAEGRYLMEPMVFARLVQEAAIRPQDVVLDVACGLGYSAAVLGQIAEAVVGLEPDATLADQANDLLTELGVENVAVVTGDPRNGYPREAPYDVILVDGGVTAVPGPLRDQLADGGRLMAVVMDGDDMGRAVVVSRIGDTFSERTLFDAAVPVLPSFAPAPAFVF